MKRRTKIVATIGPASASVSVLSRMAQAGMDVARLNFSHGTHAEHAGLIKMIRAAEKKTGKRIAILQDLQGPKIRLGELPEGGVRVLNGEKISFSTNVDSYRTDGSFPVTYKRLHKDVKKGDRLLLDDGLIDTTVCAVKGSIIQAVVKHGGLLLSHKGLSVPDSTISEDTFTKKDRDDLFFGLEQGVDAVALSFVTSASMVKSVRAQIEKICKKNNSVPPIIISKIERREAVDGFLDILNASDGIMIARGDLGVSLPPEQVPVLQKEFVEICRQAGKPVIVATHMLESMTRSPKATRAEVSDVANAVFDHTDATMLSAETATGEYPYITVKTMAAVIDEAEASRYDDISFYQIHDVGDIPTSLAQALHVMVENGHIEAIISSAGYPNVASALTIFRPNAPIYLACPNEAIAHHMLFRAGVHPIVIEDAQGTFVARMETKLRREKSISKIGRVAYVLESPGGEVQMVIR